MSELPPQLREALDVMGQRGQFGDLVALAVRTPCSEPDVCDPVTGEPCDRHETEQAHAEGEHAFCGTECEVEYPSEQLRNFILAKGYPGTAGMLDELLRRAAAGQSADAPHASVLRDFLWRLEQSSGDQVAAKLVEDNPEWAELLAATEAAT